MKSRYFNLFGCILFSLVVYSCQSTSSESIPLPSGSCQAAWNDSTALEFVALLEKSTSPEHLVWKGFNLGDGPIVLHAIDTLKEEACLGLWKNGKVISYSEVSEKPKLSTALYGYQLNFANLTDEGLNNPLVKISQQPESITTWLNTNNAESAVIIPTDFPDFPFKLPASVKVQLAIHESFHVEVMLRYWFTEEGAWPKWDQQPDRNELRSCYLKGDSLTTEFREEQMTLSHMIEALLDNKKEEAIGLGNSFLQQREARYDLLKNLEITAADGTKCSCEEGEDIMEIEEGLADYASWTMLYEVEAVSRKSLIQRYQAIQKEPFYLTGAMLMHATKLMNDNNAQPIIEVISSSSNQQEGAVIQQFKKQLIAFSEGD